MELFRGGSSFAQREIFDPANVMHANPDGYSQSNPASEEVISCLKDGEIDLGTSIMAVTYEGGVILGADSRTSTGVYIANRVTNKVTKIDEKIYVCRSGSAADTQAISDYARYFLDNHRMAYGQAPKVATAANIFQQLCYKNKNNLTAGILVAGWDGSKGGQVYSIPVGGAMLERPFTIGGSGSSYIYGFCDSYYKPNMTREQCEEFVTRALCHAMARDGSSGGVVRLVIIDETGVERKMIPGNKLPYGPL
mmetsp:Transcript_40102/g.88049  ORF Transcript_40102/g.88049 Transcript_40102/m.88049 type:complete len:251 (-) Transcript_40102:642-1394(-)